MSDHKQVLDAVYGARTAAESRAAYDQWSASYDADNLAQGFRLPALGAGLLARFLGGIQGPVLDAACGTGLVGETLGLLGLGPITGCDLSPEMLKAAHATGAYHSLVEADMGEGLPFDNNCFAGFICVGAFGPGHAPPVSLTHLARVTRPGGFGVFNLIEASYQAQGFPAVIEALSDSGQWQIVYQTAQFRPFLLSEPDLMSRAYVVRIS